MGEPSAGMAASYRCRGSNRLATAELGDQQRTNKILELRILFPGFPEMRKKN